mmetsp:Transcript_40946/g.91581  ORF Transcript_40946/g.91581 Transcript_40946/m.91581 type:complete len:258 (+) Transcript_40946:40-813(+)
MLRILYLSGDEVASFSADELDSIKQTCDNVLEGVKRRLEPTVGQPRFRQQLLQEGAVLSTTSSVQLPCDLQLVLCGFCTASEENVLELGRACAGSDAGQVERCLQRPQDPDLQDDFGRTALISAAQAGAVECARMLLEARADVDKAMHDGTTPLLIAAEQGQVEVVKLLLESGADREKADMAGATPVGVAAHRGHAEVLSWLLHDGDGEPPPHPRGVLIAFRAGQVAAQLMFGLEDLAAGICSCLPRGWSCVPRRQR